MSIPKHLLFKDPNLQAIERLITVLENAPDEQFNIGSWSCGTVYCAAGLAGCNNWFLMQGFHIDKDGDIAFNPNRLDDTYPAEYIHWHAVTKMFRMTQPEAEWIFSGFEYLNEYPEPERTKEELELLESDEDHPTQNLVFKHIPKSAVIDRLKQVLELHKYEIC